MTPESQRIAIAEACGWRFHLERRDGFEPQAQLFRPNGKYPHYQGYGSKSFAEVLQRQEGNTHFEFVPDYLNDLNAMHEAEKVLTFLQRRKFSDMLDSANKESTLYLCSDDRNDLSDAAFVFAHSTATQRAEAFIRTLNLWTE